MAAVGVYDQVKKAFQDLIAPELHAIRGDIRLLDQKIDGVDARLGAKIDAVDARLSAKIDGVDGGLNARIDAMDARLTIKIDGLRAELLAELRRVDTRIDGVDHRIESLDRELRTAIDIRERLAALEARRPA